MIPSLALLFACHADNPGTGDPDTTPATSDTTQETSTSETPLDTGSLPTSSTPVPEPIDCSSSCADTQHAAGWALCYSCQCKSAMDGWLPSPEELQCSNGAEIVIYRTDADGNLSVVDTDVGDCENPSLLYQTCKPGGTLGQLTHGTVTAKWICRRNTYHPNFTDPNLPYDDVGAILYNSRNGASCWFDDVDQTGLAGDNWPEMDLTAPDADPQQWIQYFYEADGTYCVGCHDNDPFNFTPFLQSVGWVTNLDYTFGGFSRVELNGSLSLVGGYHLTSPEVAACTSCHRLTSTETCSSWAPDSLGLYKGGAEQPAVVDAMGDLASPLWPIVTWMPELDPFPDPATWESTYGAARDRIQECCANPGVQTPDCQWTPNF